MNFHDTMSFTAGLLQFIAACYALRLNRTFGTARVGWSLFCAFALLALLHLMQVVPAFTPAAGSALKIEVVYSLISLLLLTGMVHIEMIFKERQRLEREEKALRENLEREVEKKTAHLVRVVNALQAEMEERKRMATEVAAHVGLLELTRNKNGSEHDTAHIRF
jgi:predicted membrane metal-binding protein